MGTSENAPLSGIRVLELGRLIAAPFCAQVLGDLGADVIKVERVGHGDDIRSYGPPFLCDDDAPGSQSSFYLAFNRNKRSLAIDFSRSEGAEIVRRLAAKSDVFIENYRVGALKKYGLDEVSIRALRNDIVYLSVSGFGQSGPYAERPGTDIVLQGMTGLMNITGEAGRMPMKVGVSIADMTTGLYSVIGVIAALYKRAQKEGQGEWVGVSLLDSCISLMGSPAIWNHISGEPPTRKGNSGHGSAPTDVFACRDGELLIQAGKDTDFVKLCAILRLEELLDDPRYKRRAERVIHVEQLTEVIQQVVAGWERNALYAALVKADIICGPINDIAEALTDPQVQANGVEVEAGHPDDLGLKLVSSPIRFTDGAPKVRRYPPRLGEHTTEILTELLDLSREEIDCLVSKGVISLRSTPGVPGAPDFKEAQT